MLSIESELRLKGKDPNWTNILGRVMAVVNNQSGCDCYPKTAYTVVLGQEYRQSIMCTVAEAHDDTTIDEQLHVSNDSRLEAVAKLCFVGKEDAAEQIDNNQDEGH